MSEKEETKSNETMPDLSGMLGIGGIFDGVSNLINKFGDLAEKGEAFRSAMNQGETASGKKFNTSFGMNVRFGPGRDGDTEREIKPVAKPAKRETDAPSNSVPRVREPHVEIFDEEDHVQVIAEMPGVSSENISLSFDGKKLNIHGVSKVAEFKKELELPREFGPDQVSIAANNGVVEIRLTN